MADQDDAPDHVIELEIELGELRRGDVFLHHSAYPPPRGSRVVVRRRGRPLPTVPDTLIRVDWRPPFFQGGDFVYRLEGTRWISRRTEYPAAELQAQIRGYTVLAVPRHVTIEEVLDESGGWFTDSQRRLIREWLGVQQ